MDDYDNDYPLLDDDLFFVCVFFVDENEEPDTDIAIMRLEDVD